MRRSRRRTTCGRWTVGVDVVIHSATKYLGGHNDLLAGVTLGSDKLMNEVYRMQRMIGATPGPLTCFLLERGLKTFGLRMEHHNKAGMAVARMLEVPPQDRKSLVPGPGVAPGPQDREGADEGLRQHGHLPGQGR